MQRTRVKICGLTSTADAAAAVASGADAIGLVFHPDSPRHVSVEQATEIVAALPPFVTPVGLFVNATPEVVRETVAATGITLIQFHGDESPQVCAQAPLRWVRACRVRADTDLDAFFSAFAGASGFLLDAWSDVARGGTGTTFDWSLVPAERAPRIVLAGGLTPENVQAAVRTVRPCAVDVSSGVEAAPGRKDPEKMRQFVAAVRRADEEYTSE